MAKMSTDATDLLKQMRDAIEKVHGSTLAGTWDPLVEMAVYSAGPSLSPMQKFAANRELAAYLYPKRKAIEHTGDTGGINVVVMQFTPDGHGRIVAGEIPQDAAHALTRDSPHATPAALGQSESATDVETVDAKHGVNAA